jgi:hypothetical protein
LGHDDLEYENQDTCTWLQVLRLVIRV